MGIQSAIRAILPKDDRFFDLLESQAALAHEAAQALGAFRGGGSTSQSVRARVQDLEHQADKVVHEIEDALAHTFATPLDREDLQRLSSELDDVVDRMNQVARGCDLLGVERPTEPMDRLMDKLLECTEALKTAVGRLRKHEYAALMDDARVVRRLEKDGDAVFREAISDLFASAEIDARVLIREKQILGDLEQAIDDCDHVAGTLTNLAVKHG